MMEKANSTLGLGRTKSDQLVEVAVAAMKSPVDGELGHGGGGGPESSSSNLSMKSSRRFAVASPGRSIGGSNRNTHIRKARSAQLKVDVDDVSSGAALSRASSASLGLSFSLTGFIMPPDDVADSKPFSDDEIPEDIEARAQRKKIEAEPTMPIYLKFMDVKYRVVVKGVASTEEREILHGITGSAKPGEVLALMGPSGSGKTTLLNVLGGRVTQPRLSGSITYNDQPYSKFLKSRCQDTIIGGSFVRGVSGGERKRVCIGNEIIINPSLLLLDEPTSGLDSTTALKIIQMLQDIAEAGKTVITTIHQPSSRLFHKFDKLILLGKGLLLYYGKASEAMLYFSSIGCSPLIAMNPAEFLLDLASGNLTDITIPSELEGKVQTNNSETEAMKGKPSPALIHEYLVEAYESGVAEKENKSIPIDEELKSKQLFPRRDWGASWWEQCSILFRRGLKERKHDYFGWLRITQVLVTAIILGLLWWQSDCKTTKGLQDQTGLLFFLAVFWSFFPVFTAIFTFPQERAMLKKERSADMYRLSAYFLARTTSDLPLDLLLPVLFITVVYFMAGLRLNAATFFLTILTIFLEIVAAQGLGLVIGASLMDVKTATTLASVTVMAFMLAGGYFVTKVPVFAAWLRYLSFNYYTYRLLLKVQYKHLPPAVPIKVDNGLMEVAVLVAMVFGYRLLAYMALRNMKLQS
ncbi:ABC transporter G member 22 [Ancistrocladus abbreviatus]